MELYQSHKSRVKTMRVMSEELEISALSPTFFTMIMKEATKGVQKGMPLGALLFADNLMVTEKPKKL